MTHELRIPPHSLESEQAVIGGVMLVPASLEKAASIVSESDFYTRSHRTIWRAICDLDSHGQPFDVVTLGNWFEAHGLADEAGGESYLFDLANATPSAANITAYAAIVREKSVLRQVIEAGTEAATSAFVAKGKTAQDLLDSTIQRLMSLQRSETQCEYTMKRAAALAWQDAAAAHERNGALGGITTGLHDLDAKLGGLHPGDLVIIGARPAMGKTSLLLGMARAAAESGSAAGLISGEQPAHQVGARMLSSMARIPATAFRNGAFREEDWPRLTTAVANASSMPLWMLDRSAPSITEVQRVARRWAQQHGIKALYVDYLQRIEAEGERRFEAVGAAAKGLKNLARDLNIPVVVLAQVSRQVEQRKPPEPRMGDLSDSSEIEKEADQVLMLYRDEYYNPDSERRGTARIIVEKNRHGPTGYFDVAWNPQTMTFADLSRDDWSVAA